MHDDVGTAEDGAVKRRRLALSIYAISKFYGYGGGLACSSLGGQARWERKRSGRRWRWYAGVVG